MMKKIIILIFILFLPLFVYAKDNDVVNVYFIYSDSCSHCHEELKVLNKIENKYNNVNIYKYEINDDNTRLIIEDIENLYELDFEGIPLTIIGDKYYSGFSDNTTKFLVATIDYYQKYGYIDSLGEVLEVSDLPTLKKNNDSLSVDDYINNRLYKNILFNLSIKNLDTNSISIILGLLSSFNIINIITLILLCIIIKNKSLKNIIIFFCNFFFSKTILYLILYYFNYLVLLYGLVFSFLFFILIIFLKNIINNQNNICIFLFILCLNFLDLIIFNNKFSLLKDSIKLNLLNNFESFIQIFICIFSNFLIDFCILYIVKGLLNNKNLINLKKF